MAGEGDLAGDLHALGARLDAGERDARFHHVTLDTVEGPEEIKMPPRAAELAVGCGLQADFFLPPDDARDLAIFHRFEFGRRNLALGALGPRVFQGSRAQQAADMVGAERRPDTRHSG